MATLNVGRNFSKNPSGRYNTKDGLSSGEAFREEFLRPAIGSLIKGEKLIIILDDGVEGYGSSFLTEGFAGIVKYGYMKASDLISILDIRFTDPDFEFYKNKIYDYVKAASFGSQKYIK